MVNATFVGIGKRVLIPHLSNVTKRGVKQTMGMRERARFELRNFLQASLRAMPIIMKYDRYGLGYKTNTKSHNKMMKLRREKRIASLMGVSVKMEHMVFPHICETFYSIRMQHNDIKPSGATRLDRFEKLYFNAIEGINMKKEDVRAMVSSMPSGALRNWTVTDIPTVFHLSQ